MQEEQWKEITGELFKFDTVGQQIEGLLIAREKTESMNDKENFLYRLDTGDGKLVSFFGSSHLNSRMSAVAPGEFVRVKYEKDEPPTQKGHKAMKVFKVWVRQ